MQTLTLRPGGGNQREWAEARCHGLMYEGCDFRVLPSLQQAGIKAELLCEWKYVGEHHRLYELRHSQCYPTRLAVLDGEGRERRFTTLTLTLLLSPEALPHCVPR